LRTTSSSAVGLNCLIQIDISKQVNPPQKNNSTAIAKQALITISLDLNICDRPIALLFFVADIDGAAVVARLDRLKGPILVVAVFAVFGPGTVVTPENEY